MPELELGDVYRVDDFPVHDLVIQWCPIPCPQVVAAAQYRKMGMTVRGGRDCGQPHVVALGGLTVGEDRWCAIAHGDPGTEEFLVENDPVPQAWAAAVALYGVKREQITPHVAWAQAGSALNMPGWLWEEVMEWPIDELHWLRRWNADDFEVIPRLLTITARYRHDVGGTTGRMPG